MAGKSRDKHAGRVAGYTQNPEVLAKIAETKAKNRAAGKIHFRKGCKHKPESIEKWKQTYRKNHEYK